MHVINHKCNTPPSCCEILLAVWAESWNTVSARFQLKVFSLESLSEQTWAGWGSSELWPGITEHRDPKQVLTTSVWGAAYPCSIRAISCRQTSQGSRNTDSRNFAAPLKETAWLDRQGLGFCCLQQQEWQRPNCCSSTQDLYLIHTRHLHFDCKIFHWWRLHCSLQGFFPAARYSPLARALWGVAWCLITSSNRKAAHCRAGNTMTQKSLSWD